MSKNRNRSNRKARDRGRRDSRDGSDHDDDGHQLQGPRDVGDQEERQLRQYIQEGQARQRDHEQDMRNLMAEDSQLGQPSQRLRGNARASYQRGLHSRNARMGLTESEEIMQSEEDAEGDGRNPEEQDGFDEEMGDGGGAAEEEDGDEEYDPGDVRRGK